MGFILFCFMLFLSDICFFCICLGYLGLKRPHIFREKQKIKNSTFVKDSAGAFYFGFCAVKCKNHGLESSLLGFSYIRFWALNLT